MPSFVNQNQGSIGILLAAAAVVVAFVIAWWQRRRSPGLAYVVEATPIVSVRDAVPGRVQVLFDGKPITGDVSLALVTVFSSGSVPIRPDDFGGVPLTVRLGGEASLLDSSPAGADPEDLRFAAVRSTLHKDAVDVAPLLLNPGDRFSIRLIVAGSPGEVEVQVDGRIAGVSRIRETTPRNVSDALLVTVRGSAPWPFGDLVQWSADIRGGIRREK